MEHLKPFETRPTPDQTVVVMTRGRQELEAFGQGQWRRAVYGPGTIGLTPCGATDRLRRRVARDVGPACKVNIYVPRALVEEASDHPRRVHALRPCSTLVALGGTDHVVRHAALALLGAMREGAPDLYADSVMPWLVMHLLTFGIGRAAARTHEADTITDRRLRRVLDFIAAHFAETLSVEGLAGEAGVSKFHFVRLFQRATGKTPYRYLLDMRLDTTKRLLVETELSVDEVAIRCGVPKPRP